MPIFHPLEPFPMPPTRDGSLAPMGTDRPSGRHGSEITREMAKAGGANLQSIEGEPEWMRAQIGFLWERALEYIVTGGMAKWEAMEFAWGELLLASGRPVNKQLRLFWDGIHWTPDGENTQDHLIEEYKFTWKSSSKWGRLPGPPGMLAEYTQGDLDKLAGTAQPDQHFGEWITRVAGYLYARNQMFPETAPMSKVRFIVFWANGDYSRKERRGPQPTQGIVEFTLEELEENWRTILRYRDWMDKRDQEAAK